MAETSVWVLGDQLLRVHPAIAAARASGSDFQVVMVENWARARRLPYHQKKLTLIFSAMRHYADALRAQGIAVDYRRSDSLAAGLRVHAADYRPTRVLTMAASEYHGRAFQAEPLARVTGAQVEVLPNTQFLIGQHNPFPNPKKQVILETFYRAMRRHFGLLLDADGEPEGGQWNFDHANRKPLPRRGIALPEVDGFAPDALTAQVIEDVRAAGHGVGRVDGFRYAVTHADAGRALTTFIDERLARFGDYEDAMTARSRTLYHSVLSPYLNLGLLEPLPVVRAAVDAYQAGGAPLNAVEGFVRQIVGWREYMAWQYWRQMPDLAHKNGWNAQRPVPRMFWDGETDMNCVRHVVGGLLDDGYSHHIERLMIVSNFFMLAGVEPADAVRWFSAMYIDAYDWVMQTNVIGMGLNADGGQTATKPYIASANYIHKMSDYCAGCAFDHKARHGERACPFNTLYWNFLIEHETALRANPRFGPAVLGLKHLDEAERVAVRAAARAFLDGLSFETEGA